VDANTLQSHSRQSFLWALSHMREDPEVLAEPVARASIGPRTGRTQSARGVGRSLRLHFRQPIMSANRLGSACGRCGSCERAAPGPAHKSATTQPAAKMPTMLRATDAVTKRRCSLSGSLAQTPFTGERNSRLAQLLRWKPKQEYRELSPHQRISRADAEGGLLHFLSRKATAALEALQ
jgi:hypothetical protein